MADETAAALAPNVNAGKGRCMPALFRDAARSAMSELGFDIAAAGQRPGLRVHGSDDDFIGDGAMHRFAARRAGARVAELLDVGHWWMHEKPGLAAHAVASWLRSVREVESSI